MNLPLTAGRSRAYALLVTLLTLGVIAVAISSTLSVASNNALLIDRSIAHQQTVAAAEAATEKVIAAMMRDFRGGGEANVNSRMGSYRSRVPTVADSTDWTEYLFYNMAGATNRSQVQRIGASTAAFTPLDSQYSGLYGLASNFRVTSNARTLRAGNPVAAAVQQEIQLATIPVFQFAIFYSIDLEINPGPNMDVTGRVHSNSNLFMQPGNSLTFQSHVTAAGQLIEDKSPLDPTSRRAGSITYNAEHDSGVSSLTLPVGDDNSPEAVRQILSPPPGGEASSSLIGQQRYHNKTDLVVTVEDSGVTVSSGAFNGFATAVPWSQASGFLNTNVTFFDQREGAQVQATQIDVAALKTWSENSNPVRAALGGLNVSSVYVDDRRTQNGTIPGVKVINGSALPDRGLTVATSAPLYVQGDFNAPAADRGTANTANTQPASLVADAITVLSGSWNDASSALSLSSRRASDTTVNAAFIGGIVPSNGTHYSGGVENFPRFLEDWSSRTLTYNGSMVVMFSSAVARTPWSYGDPVYKAPRRNWAFDVNFLDPTKLPPGTPSVRAMIRSKWTAIAPAALAN